MKVTGIWRYVYRAVDQNGQVVDVFVSRHRDIASARRFFTASLRAHRIPTEVHQTSISRAVQRLEASGYTTRQEDSLDRRIRLVKLTTSDRSTVHFAALELNGGVFEVLGLDQDQMRNLLQVLRHFRANAGDF